MQNGWAHTDVRRVRTLAPRPAPIGAGVVGCGYWGPNLARNLAEVAEFELRGLCDREPEPLRSLARRHPDVQVYRDFDHMLADETIKAVVITTPPDTHHPLGDARRSALASTCWWRSRWLRGSTTAVELAALALRVAGWC